MEARADFVSFDPKLRKAKRVIKRVFCSLMGGHRSVNAVPIPSSARRRRMCVLQVVISHLRGLTRAAPGIVDELFNRVALCT